MLNIIQADLFKVRKGKAFLGVMLGLFLTLILVAIVFKVVSAPTFNDYMSGAQEYYSEDDMVDINEAQQMLPSNGGEFLLMMFREIASSYAFFILPFIITVFGADYSSGTYRNLLSYHSGRTGIFAAKMITTTIITIAMLIGAGILAFIVGGILFGFGGFSAAVIVQVLKAMIFMLPILLAFIALGYCITALTKKTSYTIAIYFVTLLVWSVVIQLPAMLIPGMGWLMDLDLMNSLKTAAQYAGGADVSLAVPMVFSIILMIGSGVLGLIKYKTTDFDFS